MNSLVKTISTRVLDAVRLIKFLGKGLSDVREREQVLPYGFDSNPIKGMVALYAETTEKGKSVIVGYLNKNQLADIGENRIFSTDENGSQQFYIWLKNNGTCEIGGNTKHMVRFEELETGFNQLKTDFNNLVTIFNAHVHSGVTPGVGSSAVTPTQGVSSNADISDSKINEIKTL